MKSARRAHGKLSTPKRQDAKTPRTGKRERRDCKHWERRTPVRRLLCPACLLQGLGAGSDESDRSDESDGGRREDMGGGLCDCSFILLLRFLRVFHCAFCVEIFLCFDRIDKMNRMGATRNPVNSVNPVLASLCPLFFCSV